MVVVDSGRRTSTGSIIWKSADDNTKTALIPKTMPLIKTENPVFATTKSITNWGDTGISPVATAIMTGTSIARFNV